MHLRSLLALFCETGRLLKRLDKAGKFVSATTVVRQKSSFTANLQAWKMARPQGSQSLIVTTFRLPFTTHKNEGEAVGRTESRDEWARSLAHVVISSGGRWVGWPGAGVQEGEEVPEPQAGDKSPTARLTADQVLPVFLTDDDRALAYSGCCKSGFWPLLHSKTHCRPGASSIS